MNRKFGKEHKIDTRTIRGKASNHAHSFHEHKCIICGKLTSPSKMSNHRKGLNTLTEERINSIARSLEVAEEYAEERKTF